MGGIKVKVTTLGTSHGSPTRTRFNTSTLVQTGEQMVLIDAGAPADALMVREGKVPGLLNAVFITHMHDDHTGGLSSIIKSIEKFRSNNRKKHVQTHIYLPEEGAIAPLLAWVDANNRGYGENIIFFHGIRQGLIYQCETLKVQAMPTGHLATQKKASYAFALDAEGKRIVFTGDLSSDFLDFPVSLIKDGCDLCVCECTHFPAECAVAELNKYNSIKRIVFNHVADRWHGATGEERFYSAFEGLKIEFQLSFDGFSLEI